MSNEVNTPEMQVFKALAAAQQAMMDLAKPLAGYKPVMKRLDLAMTALESANLWLSAALMAHGELQAAAEKAMPEQMVVPAK
jgi:hypothetical protein